MERKHLVSVVIRTLNEERYLPELLESIKAQESERFSVEVVLVDSGSTDNTLMIAESFGARIVHIAKRDFSFGRSLNLGCGSALGDYLVFISGHCIPVDAHWIDSLVAPLLLSNVNIHMGDNCPETQLNLAKASCFKNISRKILEFLRSVFFITTPTRPYGQTSGPSFRLMKSSQAVKTWTY